MDIPKIKFFNVENPSIAQKFGKSRSCRYCGQFPEKGESFGIVVTQIAGTSLAKIINNFCIHEKCWEECIDGFQTFEEVLYFIAKRPQPRAKNAILPDESRVKIVKNALYNLDFKIDKETKNRIYFRKRGSRRKTSSFFYEKRFNYFEFTGKTRGWLDKLIIESIFSDINNEINRLEEEIENKQKSG